jgi:transcriptional regulator with XRE-family HTH domain
VLLDVGFVNELRLRAGLSRRQLRRVVGFDDNRWRMLARGRGHDALTIGALVRLGDALGVHPGALLEGGRQVHADAAGDDIKLEAALLSLDGMTRIETVSAALGWDMTRGLRAAASLRRRLAGTGSVFVSTNTGIALRAREEVLTDTERSALARGTLPAGGMTITAARLLRRVTAGELEHHEFEWGAQDRVSLRELVTLGYLVCDADGYRLADRVERGCRPYARPTQRITSTRRQKRNSLGSTAGGGD